MAKSWLNAGVAVLLVVTVGACGSRKHGVNEPCMYNTDCADEICHDGICGSSHPLSNGSPCSGNGECSSYSCAGGQCVPGSGTETYGCLYSDECASGLVCCAFPCCGYTTDYAATCCTSTNCCVTCAGVFCIQSADGGL